MIKKSNTMKTTFNSLKTQVKRTHIHKALVFPTTDSDLKVMQINSADERTATAMREMVEYLVKHGKKQ